MVSGERLQIVEQSLSTTLRAFERLHCEILLARSSFQICSIGFISGVYGGINTKRIFSGTINAFALCNVTPSHTKMILLFGYDIDKWSRNIFMHWVLQYSIINKQLSPLSFLHQQHFVLFIRPKPASSQNFRNTLECCVFRYCETAWIGKLAFTVVPN